ncbi:unnamed protein product [Rhizophagus irregularis]|nr:unnamed protein product [Rhizophagus irregularis]
MDTYNQFYEIKETGKNWFITLYSVIWRDGPLDLNRQVNVNEYERAPNKKVALKHFHNSQDFTDFVINEAEEYSLNRHGHKINEIYGISQNPDTNDYILVLNNINWISGNEKIDDFIQEMQLKINEYHDEVFEWIPYYHENYTRYANKEVALKCFHNSQDLIELVINEVYHF